MAYDVEAGSAMRIPVVDIGTCTLCMGCVALCPEVFHETDAGYIEVIEMACYPEAAVDETIKYCPEDCIGWEER